MKSIYDGQGHTILGYKVSYIPFGGYAYANTIVAYDPHGYNVTFLDSSTYIYTAADTYTWAESIY